jgi:hypothetical protein
VLGSQRRQRLPDARVALGPVVAPAREQMHPAVPLARDQAVAVMLDLVNPLRSDRGLGRSGRNARLDSARPLRRLTSTPQHAAKMASGGLLDKGTQRWPNADVDSSDNPTYLARRNPGLRTQEGSHA